MRKILNWYNSHDEEWKNRLVRSLTILAIGLLIAYCMNSLYVTLFIEVGEEAATFR